MSISAQSRHQRGLSASLAPRIDLPAAAAQHRREPLRWKSFFAPGGRAWVGAFAEQKTRVGAPPTS
jgi:hypothetical protein